MIRRSLRAVNDECDEEWTRLRPQQIGDGVVVTPATYSRQDGQPLPAKPPTPGPRDPFNFALITMFLFGIGSLLPWNFFITADDYWKYKFRDVSTNSTSRENSELQTLFPSYLAIASKVPYIASLVANTYLSNRVSPAMRMGWSLFGCTILFVVTAALVKVDTDQHQLAFLGGTLAIVALINLSAGFLQGGGTGLAGCFPVKYMAANVYGQAVGGIFATVAQIFSLMTDASPTTTALLYFTLAIITLIFTQICFGVLVKMRLYRHFVALQAVSYGGIKDYAQSEQKASLWEIFAGGWTFFISIVLIFWVTLSVFPGVVVSVSSVHASNLSPLTNKYFIPLACFMVFNVSDLLGRITSAYAPLSASWKKTILVLCLARVVFVPLFLLCNTRPREHLPLVFDSDALYVVFMALFGLSNGYLTNLTLIYGSKSASTENQQLAGSMAAVFLGVGLMLGSLSSYGTIKLL